SLVASLAATVEALHQQGVLHLDLKPSNILIDSTGRPRLLDFGLAAMTRPWDEPAPEEDGISGTLHYMAPEQALGRAERIGPRTDVFGLGAILYEPLSGRPPYEAQSRAELLDRVRQARVIPPSRRRSGVPGSLERICLKALAADPADRYASAAQLERALRRDLRRPFPLAALAGGARPILR